MRTKLLTLTAFTFLTGYSAFGATLTLTGLLNGANENPAVITPGTGSATVIYDNVAHTLRVIVDFQDLVGTVSAGHIHCCVAPPGNAGVATTVPTFPGFPSGVTSGSYDQTLDLTMAGSFNPTFVTNHGGTLASAEADLAQGLHDGLAYLNIHTSFKGGGEIRAFLTPIPEPGTFVFLGGALAGVWLLRRRR